MLRRPLIRESANHIYSDAIFKQKSGFKRYDIDVFLEKTVFVCPDLDIKAPTWYQSLPESMIINNHMQ